MRIKKRNKSVKKFDKKRKPNKRGSLNFFGEHTLGIIVGVACFVILVFTSDKAYGFFRDTTNSQNAEKYVNVIKSSFDDAKINIKHESIAEVFGPANYWVIAWPYKSQIEKPYSCKGYDSCICICTTGNGITDSLNQCNIYGKCAGVEGNIKTIYNKSPPSWYQKIIKGTADFFGGDTTNIPLPIDKPPIQLKITYDEKTGYTVTSE